MNGPSRYKEPGWTSGKLRTSNGDVNIQVPRARNGDVRSKVLAKHQTSTNELEAKILALYTKELSTCDNQARVQDLYVADISPATSSAITRCRAWWKPGRTGSRG